MAKSLPPRLTEQEMQELANSYIEAFVTQSECLTTSTLIKERRHDVVLVCGEVYR